MKEFIWHLRCMYSAKKYMKESEQCRTEYFWYRHLVRYEISSFFSRLKFWERSGELPF